MSLAILFKKPSTEIKIKDSDEYTKYLKELVEINKKLDSVRMEINTVRFEKTLIKEKYYCERKKITTGDINQLDSIIRVYSNIR